MLACQYQPFLGGLYMLASHFSYGSRRSLCLCHFLTLTLAEFAMAQAIPLLDMADFMPCHATVARC